MQSSVTSERVKSGRSARKLSSSADAEAALSGRSGLELIDGPEVQVARDEDLNTITLILGDGRRDIDRALQHLLHDALPAGGIDDDRPAVAGTRLDPGLHRAIDHRNQERGTKALKEMSIHIPRESGAA